MTFIVIVIALSYFDTLLLYVLSVTFCGAVFLKLWTKRHSLSTDEVI